MSGVRGRHPKGLPWINLRSPKAQGGVECHRCGGWLPSEYPLPDPTWPEREAAFVALHTLCAPRKGAIEELEKVIADAYERVFGDPRHGPCDACSRRPPAR